MEGTAIGYAALVERLGAHASEAAGLDPAAEPGAWFTLACLLGGRVDEARARRGFEALRRAGLVEPGGIAKAGALAVEAALLEGELPKSDAAALRLWRASRALVERYDGSLDVLAAAADDLPDLAERLASLASGVGAATVLRFLRPLRDAWPAARETPLAPAARAAAVHLGWIREGEDEDGEPGALRAALARDEQAPRFADVEAALERLGARACLRDRPNRCPLGDSCPQAGQRPARSEPT